MPPKAKAAAAEAAKPPETEPSDVEAAEARAIAEVEAGLVFDDPFFATGDCRDAMLAVIKQSVDWSKKKEGEQRDIIAAVVNSAVTIVQKISRAIASEAKQSATATLESMTVKDGVKIVLKGPYDHATMLMLGDAQGAQVLISVPNSERFNHSRAPAAYDKDQPEMPLAGPEGDTDLVEAATGLPSNRKVVRDEESGTLKVVHAESGLDLGPPSDAEVAAFETAGAAGAKGDALAGLAEGERVNLKSSMVERLLPGREDKAAVGDDDYEDIRDATPAELAAERERQADFPD